MLLLRKLQEFVLMASVMMAVVTAAVASALFAKVRDHVPAASMPSISRSTPQSFSSWRSS